MLLGLGPHVGAVIDDAGDGADRAAADAGDIFDRQIRHGEKHLVSWKIFGNGVGNVSSGYSMAQSAQKINRSESLLAILSNRSTRLCAG